MKPSPEATAWARALGLGALPAKWRTTISLDDNGEIPKHAATKRSTRFRLVVEESAWSVAVWKRGKCFNYAKTVGARAAIIDGSLVLTPPKLAKVRAWLRDVERDLDIAFRRDRPAISSNVKGATKLIVRWLGEEWPT